MKRLFKMVVWIGVILILLALAGALVFGAYSYVRLTKDLPKIQGLSDYRPKAVSKMYSSGGELLSEIYGERRYPAKFEEIPPIVKNAFLAAEDANFYNHPGIDFVSISRAVWVNLVAGGTKQGASTITQQIVKSLLLTREKTYERKAKEAILAYRLEKSLTKDEIFSIYLNEIFLGAGAYGIKAAGKIYFHKELSDLNTAEAAFLAGLPQRPSFLAKPKNREVALRRQRYVLSQMLKNQFISEDEYEEAKNLKLQVHLQNQDTIYAAPYFTSHAIHEAKKILKNLEIPNALSDPGGYQIETTVDIKAYEIAEKAVKANLRTLDKRQGWRGTVSPQIQDKRWFHKRFDSVDDVSDIKKDEVYPAIVRSINKKGIAEIQVGGVGGTVNLKKSKWARRFLNEKGRARGVRPERKIKTDDWIEVSLKEAKEDNTAIFKLDQTPLAQSAMTVINALTGEVKAIIGGYDYSQSQFNRATQGLLQPGSSFKPFIYLAAIQDLGYTPASIVPDSPVSYPSGNGEIWSPQNYDHTFLGPITLRTALQSSRNVVSVYLLDRLGVRRGINSARKLGITTPIGPNMSISLGTAEVKQIELVRAYGAFAAEGWLANTIVIKSIKDRDGNEVYVKHPELEQVIEDPADAFLMANMMKGVVERGTAQRVKALKRPVAGKTGTTNDQMDAWFVGYTPEWTAGVWVGFDVKKTLGKTETGGKAAAPAFISFMKEWLKDEPKVDFSIPDDVIPVSIDLRSGRLASSGAENPFTEYFKSGTEPRYTGLELEIPRDYLSNDEF